MLGPPTPILPAVLLAAAAKLGWRLVTRSPSGAELGEMIDLATGTARALVLSRGETASAVVWGLCDGPAAPPLAALVLDRPTFDVLHGGTAAQDGAVTYQGRTYRLAFTFNGAQLVAVAVAVA